MTTTPDPITTAREALGKLNKHVKPELNSPNCDRFNQIYAAFDYAEKLKAERDELEKSVSSHWKEIEHLNAATDSEITRLTSQLDELQGSVARLEAEKDAERLAKLISWDRADGLQEQLREAESTRDRFKAERDEFAATIVSLAEHRNALISQLDQAERVIRAQEKALKLHHTWQGSDEPYGLELTPGNWIELNRGAEYADSSMYEVTMDAIRAASQWIKDRQAKTDGEAS